MTGTVRLSLFPWEGRFPCAVFTDESIDVLLGRLRPDEDVHELYERTQVQLVATKNHSIVHGDEERGVIETQVRLDVIHLNSHPKSELDRFSPSGFFAIAVATKARSDRSWGVCLHIMLDHAAPVRRKKSSR